MQTRISTSSRFFRCSRWAGRVWLTFRRLLTHETHDGAGGRVRVCQVNVTRIRRERFSKFWISFSETCRSFSGRHTVPFVRTWNRAQNWGRQTGPLVEKLVAKLTTAAYDLVAKNIFWSQMATRRPDFSSPALPLVSHAKTADVTRAWFADDASAADKLIQLHKWWTILAEVGPRYGYFVNAPKTWLVVKENLYEVAVSMFGSTGVQITTEGRPLLGGPPGTS